MGRGNALVLFKLRTPPLLRQIREMLGERYRRGRGVEVEEDEALRGNVCVDFEEALYRYCYPYIS